MPQGTKYSKRENQDAHAYSTSLDMDIQLSEKSALAKYLKDPAHLDLPQLRFEELRSLPLDQAPFSSIQAGINFEQKVGLGVDNTELTIGAGISGGIKLHSEKDKQLFDPDLFGDSIPISGDQIYLTVQNTAKLSSDLSAKNGDLSFGLNPRYCQLKLLAKGHESSENGFNHFRDSVIDYLWLDANNFFPSIEPRPHHFPISSRSVQMSPYAKMRVNDAEGREKTLPMARRLEPSHHTFPQPGGLMRILCAVVLIFLLEVFDTRHHFSLRGAVAL